MPSLFGRLYWRFQSVFVRLRRTEEVGVINLLFDADYYRSQYLDVKNAGIDPLTHFLVAGAKEGRNPHPLFDIAYYLARNPDVAASSFNPLVHFLAHGAWEGRKPHALFDPAYYLRQNPEVAASGANPWFTSGEKESSSD